MRRLLCLVVPALLMLVAGCATTPEPVPTAYVPIAPGMARIVFYRIAAPYDPTLEETISLNEKKVGVLPLGDAFYRDVAPGTYTVSFTPTRVVPHQFKTITLASGNVFYVRVAAMPNMDCSLGVMGSNTCDVSGFTAEVVSPAVAQSDMRGVVLTSG